MSTTITKKAFAPAQLTASAATYYTCPANVRSKFIKLTVANNDTVVRLVTAYLVPSGGTAGVTNIVSIAVSLNPNETRDFYHIEGHTVSAGDFLSMLADSAAKVTVHCTVAETGL